MATGKLDIMINNAAIIDESKPSILDKNLSDFERVIHVGNQTSSSSNDPRSERIHFQPWKCFRKCWESNYPCIFEFKACSYWLDEKWCGSMELESMHVFSRCSYFIVTQLFQLRWRWAIKIKGVVLRPEDLANAALYLASDEARFISGHNLKLDGGFTITK